MACHDHGSHHCGCSDHHHGHGDELKRDQRCAGGCHDTCHEPHGKKRPSAKRPPLKVDFDTQEWTELMAILEEMEDQEQACALLAELNEKSAAWGKLFMNLAPDLESAAWKKACDQAQEELRVVLDKIKSYA